MAALTKQPSFLATRRGKLTLALLASVAFLDFVDASIVNIALPSIRRDLHFSEQGLQWVPSAYLLTYGGFMLLGGRAADAWNRAGGWRPRWRTRCSRGSLPPSARSCSASYAARSTQRRRSRRGGLRKAINRRPVLVGRRSFPRQWR